MLSEATGFCVIFICTLSGAYIYSYSLTTTPRLTSPAQRFKSSTLKCTLPFTGWRMVPAPKNCHQEPDTIIVGGKWICTTGSLFLLNIGQHIEPGAIRFSMWVAGLQIWIYQVARLFFFHLRSGKKRKYRKREMKLTHHTRTTRKYCSLTTCINEICVISLKWGLI